MTTDNNDQTRTTPAGWILLSQPVHWTISPQEMAQSLPPATHDLPRYEVVIDLQREIPMAEASKIDWADARQHTERVLEERLRPILERTSGYHIAYFGAAPIPLAIFLGFRVGSWATVHPFQKSHDTKTWSWKAAEKSISVDVQGMPHDRSRAQGDVIIRVATSHPIEPQDTLDIVPEPLAEISITTTPANPDALSSSGDLEAVALEFERALDAVVSHYPNAKCLHVFAAVPVGMAFRLGASISATKHVRVRTYQYNRHAQPKYAPAILLQERSERMPILDDVARDRASATRKLWEEERERLTSYGETLRRNAKSTDAWLKVIFQQASKSWRPEVRIANLPSLWKVGFDNMRVAQQLSDLTEFRYDANSREWQFGDALLAGISRHLSLEDDIRRAGRLFLLHEGVHELQGVTSATSPRIGRFPKLLEEIDYLADVWAMIHDYALERDTSAKKPDVRSHFLKCIDVALGSFWGFDDQGTELEEIQIRRLHRYLIWTWQKLRLERANNNENDVTHILFGRPMIELAGPRIITHSERIFFDLNPRHVENPEIMVLDGDRVRRHGDGPSAPVRNILEGFRRRDSGIIRDGLLAIFDQSRVLGT